MSLPLQVKCTVCGQTTSKARQYGGRLFCETHIAEFATDIPPVWRASILVFGLMIAQIGILAAIEGLIGNTISETGRVFLAFATTLLPPIVWFVLLYRIGTRSGFEFSPLIPVAAIIAALAAAAAVNPFLNQILDIDGWLANASPANRLIGNILLYGLVNIFVLYVIVRYLLWNTPAFSRRVDGILFSMAIMWGYATTLNIIFVTSHEPLSVLHGGLRLLTSLCAQQTAGLVMGYFLSTNRFEDMPAYYLTVGVGVAGTLNGLLLYTGSALNIIALNLSQDGFSPWPGMIAGLVAVAGSFAAIRGLMRRHNTQTLIRLERHL